MPLVDVSKLCELLLTNTTEDSVTSLRNYPGLLNDVSQFLVSTKVVRGETKSDDVVFSVDDTYTDELVDTLNTTYFAGTPTSDALREQLFKKFEAVLNHFLTQETLSKFVQMGVVSAYTRLHGTRPTAPYETATTVSVDAATVTQTVVGKTVTPDYVV